MVALKLEGFGGMLPAQDDRLLPPTNASYSENAWLQDGSLVGFRQPREVFTLSSPNIRYAYRIPKGNPADYVPEANYWLEFINADTQVVKSPVADTSDPSFYWANGAGPPGYTTMSRLEDGLPYLVLGIPQGNEVTAIPSGGESELFEMRSYTSTFVSKYGEEGPPADPSGPTAGRADDTWTIGLTPPSVSQKAGRNLEKVRIYRTITSQQGIAVFYFVAELPFVTTTYSDTLASEVVASQGQLQSISWQAPPVDLQGIVAMANGVLAGWKGNELWFSEPYRPHAWPPEYQLSTEFNIVGMVAIDQTLVIGTQGNPYYCTGVQPAAFTLRRLPAIEPCTSRGSFVATPAGAFYTSPNGLVFMSTAGIQNTTLNVIPKDEWNNFLRLGLLHAAALNEGYYVFSGVVDGGFQNDAFQANAFQMADTGPFFDDGALLNPGNPRLAVMTLKTGAPTRNVMQDVWTGDVLIIRSNRVHVIELVKPMPLEKYIWRSKVFSLSWPSNLGAARVSYTVADGMPAESQQKTIRVYANEQLIFARTLPRSNEVFRLPGGRKYDNYQFELEGHVRVRNAEIASTVKELRSV